jgi:lipopolysaccharide export system protein LptA
LHLQERLGADGKKRHDFEARDRVEIKSRNYTGYGDRASYDQTLDRMTLVGDMAVLMQETQPGKPPRRMEGRELEYYVKLNHTKVKDGGRTPMMDLPSRNQGLPVKGQKRN